MLINTILFPGSEIVDVGVSSVKYLKAFFLNRKKCSHYFFSQQKKKPVFKKLKHAFWEN